MIQTNNSVYITHYVRSAFSKAHPIKSGVDAYEQMPAINILSELINRSIEKLGISRHNIEEIILGCALPVKDQWSFGGRYGIFLSQLSLTCASKLIERQCASGLDTLTSGAQSILHSGMDLVMCGGYENMSRVPIGPTLFHEGILTVPQELSNSEIEFDIQVAMNMGLTAEKLAEKYSINRREMDAYACQSHYRVQSAIEAGFFKSELIDILDDNQKTLLANDANHRPETNLESLGNLKPAFKDNGSITPGNCSPLSSGAAMVLLSSKNAMKKHHLTPMAQIIASTSSGINPEFMGEGIIPAVEKLLSICGLSINEIDIWEINEAFSVVPLAAIKYFNLDEEKVNIHGGSLAIGHPLGATGVRLVGTLARSLIHKKLTYGIACLCVGGGQGVAMLIKNAS